jgi:hypothetical protein
VSATPATTKTVSVAIDRVKSLSASVGRPRARVRLDIEISSGYCVGDAERGECAVLEQ